MAELDRVFKGVSEKFKFNGLNVYQKDAITYMLNSLGPV